MPPSAPIRHRPPRCRRLFTALRPWLVLLWLVALSPAAAAATRVLYLGDSFSKGAFGRTLDARMRATGLEVFTSVTGGASAYDWLPEFGTTATQIGYWEKTPDREFRVTHLARIPKINELTGRWRPHLVVVQGGTNMYSVLTSKRRPKADNIRELERLIHRIGQIVSAAGARLYWITPASAHPDRFSPDLQAEMRAILHRVVNRYGRTFDSYAVTRFTGTYPGTDGIHYGPTEAAAWSNLVADDVIDYAARLGGGRRARSLEPIDPEALPSRPPPRRRGLLDLFRRRRTPAEPMVMPPADATPRADATPPVTPATTDRTAASPPLQLEVVLLRKSAVRNLSEVTYRSALGVFEYEVVSVIRGTYPGKTIRIAHLIVMNNEFTTINQRAPGFRMSLEVEPLSKYPNLEKIQTIDDLDPAYDLDLFVPKL